MKSKILSLFLLTAILSVAMISATVTFTANPSTITFTDTINSVDIVINNTGDETATFTIPTIKVNDVTVALSSSTFDLAPSTTKTVTATVTSSALDNVIGDYTKTVQIKAKSTTTTNESSEDLVVEVNGGEYCDFGVVGDLDINRVNFDNLGVGKDDEWYLTDEISVEVRVKNTGSNDVDNVIVAWGLYNTKTGDFILDDEEKNVDIKDGEQETVTFSFTIDPNDFDTDYSEGDFVFLVKAYGDDDGEDVQCDWRQEDITLKKDNHYVLLTDLAPSSDIIPCGGELEIDGEAWNIGDSDEEDVYIQVYNKELGINERIDLGDLDVLDSKKFSFSYLIPKDATEKLYTPIEFRVFDDSDDIFQNDNDDDAIFTTSFKVEGNCKGTVTPSSVVITADLDSETPKAVAGKQVIINANLRNTADTEVTYTVSVLGNSEWSSLSAIDPRTVTLAAGESKDVSIYLDIDKSASGEKEFTIRATYGDYATDQKVALAIESGVSQSAIMDHLKNNWFIYVIIIVNIILIIAIIMVVRSMVSRTPSR